MRNITEYIKNFIRKRKNGSSLNDVVFLDIDGVVNTDIYNYGQIPFNKECISNVNRLCKEYDLKIVITSSWKEDPDCLQYLYNSGLDRTIPVIGVTEDLDGFRENEIRRFLDKHSNIGTFIILDDIPMKNLSDHQIRTLFSKGFDEEKYNEAKALLQELLQH